MGYIYKITNTVNGKIYVGKTEETVERRFYEHKLSVKTGKKQSKLYSAMKHYGVDNFIVEEIDSASDSEELCKKEIAWIKKLNSRDSNVGYNVSEGGNGGRTWDQKGTVTLHKGNRNTHIKPELVDEYLSNGWVLGGKKLGKAKGRSSGKWIHKDNTQKRVFESELDEYLSEGWSLGYCERAKRNLSISHIGKEPSNKGTPMSEESKNKLRNTMRNYRWMHKGDIQTEVMRDKVDEYLSNGWDFGRIKCKNTEGGDINEKVNNNKDKI